MTKICKKIELVSLKFLVERENKKEINKTLLEVLAEHGREQFDEFYDLRRRFQIKRCSKSLHS